MNSQCCADMWKFLVRTVEIQISNTTQDIILKNPRTYFHSGYSSVPPSPAVPPGSSDTFQFSNPPFKGCMGVVVYEVANFTLAIYFSNPLNYCLHSLEFDLELKQKQKQTNPESGELKKTDSVSMELKKIYKRMSRATSSVTPGTCQHPVERNSGHIKVIATMSNIRRSVIRVVVGEQEGLGEEPRRDTRC